MKLSVVITIFNEESTLDSLMQALKKQTLPPAEILIGDGGSTDGSIAKLEAWKKDTFFRKKLIFFQKKGNRSVGRNAAIQKASSEWIAITDAGCIPEPDWLEKLVQKQQETKAAVVSGAAFGIARTSFEKAVIPYVLVMPERINPDEFLPATRSLLMNKSVWKKLGGFDTTLDHNEDYAFAHAIKNATISRSFAAQAQVGWLPRKNLWSFAHMIFRFAYGDAQARIERPKVLFLFARYAGLFFLLFLWYVSFFSEKYIFFQMYGIYFFLLFFFVYLLWAIQKNKKYVGNGWAWLPILQLTADIMVMAGTLSGMFAASLHDEKRSTQRQNATD